MKAADILIVGSGSLAAGVVLSLSQVPTGPIRIAILGRSLEKVSRMAVIANARATMFETRVTFQPLQLTQFKARAFSQTTRSLKPTIIFHAASMQSPWESAEGQNGWTKLVASAGFGITLPLQLALAAELCRGASDSEAAIINACYPDCVNVALHHLGLPVTCGIGNSAIVEAFCRAHPAVAWRGVRVVAHHGHLAPWLYAKRSAHQPRVWVSGREIDPLRLRPKFAKIDEELNHVTSSTAVSVILSLLTGSLLHQSLPGVAGLPGGYPFVLKNRKFTLRLPPGVTREQAIAHNKTGEHSDGLDLGSAIKFLGKANHALASVGFEYAQGFDLTDWPTVLTKMLALRQRLRSKSA